MFKIDEQRTGWIAQLKGDRFPAANGIGLAIGDGQRQVVAERGDVRRAVAGQRQGDAVSWGHSRLPQEARALLLPHHPRHGEQSRDETEKEIRSA